MMRKAMLFDLRHRGDHMKPPELTKLEMIEVIVAEIVLLLPSTKAGSSHVVEERKEQDAGTATVPQKKK